MMAKQQDVQRDLVALHGASGRVGRRIGALVREASVAGGLAGGAAVTISAAVVRAGSAAIGTRLVEGWEEGPTIASVTEATRDGVDGDVVVDFSQPDGVATAIELARACDRGCAARGRGRAALLVGTTGLPTGVMERLRDEARHRAVLVASNTSLGVAALAEVAARAAKLLGPGYRCSIVEAHHAAKKDAPSGTAKSLSEVIRAAGGELPGDQVVSIRGGDVIGEHTIRFAGQGEYVELTHRATTRDLFARGAIRAAAWLAGKGPAPGGRLWTMRDVLGLG